jgi:hypothetical protein
VPPEDDIAWLDGTYTPADIWLAELDLALAPVGTCNAPPAKRQCEAPPLPSGAASDEASGEFLLSLSPVIYPSQTLLFRAHLEVTGDAVQLSMRPLAKETGADLGEVWEPTELLVEDGGRFSARFDLQHLPLEAFPLLEDPFLVLNDIVLHGVILGPDRVCGAATGVAQVFGTSVADALAALPAKALLIDGELVVENDAGSSDFSALQADLSANRKDRFAFYAFDIMHLDGHDITAMPLVERKRVLKGLIGEGQEKGRDADAWCDVDETYLPARREEWPACRCCARTTMTADSNECMVRRGADDGRRARAVSVRVRVKWRIWGNFARAAK